MSNWKKILMHPMQYCVFALTVFLSAANGQPPPSNDDSSGYHEAYSLIFDDQERAKRAKEILTNDGTRDLKSLSEKELSLLCRVWNELGDTRQQFIVAEHLWHRNPSSKDGSLWINNSLSNLSFDPGGAQEVINFVDDVKQETINESPELLVWKAQAVLNNEKQPAKGKKTIAADLLVEAFAIADSIAKKHEKRSNISTNILDRNELFRSVFNSKERASLKRRMVEGIKDKSKGQP